MAVGVKGLMFANLAFSAVPVESASIRFRLWDSRPWKEDRLGSPSSVKRSLDLSGRIRGVERGDVIEQAELGDPRMSKRRMAFIVLVGGEGDWRGLERRKLRFCPHCNKKKLVQRAYLVGNSGHW